MGDSPNRVGIILQARMGSTRLPGKVLRPLAGKPMLQRIIERLQRSRWSRGLVVATGESEQDRPILQLCHELGVRTFRGSEDDVLDRYYRCAHSNEFVVVARVTGDNPFVDSEECDRVIEVLERDGLDYVCSAGDRDGGPPVGVGVEAFRFNALERSWREGRALHHREHVNEYILESRDRFATAEVKVAESKQASGLSLTVDTLEEFERADDLHHAYFAEHEDSYVPVEWVIRQVADNP